MGWFWYGVFLLEIAAGFSGFLLWIKPLDNPFLVDGAKSNIPDPEIPPEKHKKPIHY